MKQYEYKFTTDEVIAIEISDEWAGILEELDRKEYNNDHAETRRHVSLDAGTDGNWLSTAEGKTFIKCAGRIFSPDDKRFKKGRKVLSKKQSELYESVYDCGDSIGEYAADNNIKQSTASHRNSVVVEKFKKIFG